MHSWSNSQLAQIYFNYMHQATVLNYRLLKWLALHTLCVQMWKNVNTNVAKWNFWYKEIKKLWQRCDCDEEMDWSTVWCRTEIMAMRWRPRKDAINTGKWQVQRKETQEKMVSKHMKPAKKQTAWLNTGVGVKVMQERKTKLEQKWLQKEQLNSFESFDFGPIKTKMLFSQDPRSPSKHPCLESDLLKFVLTYSQMMPQQY